MVKEVEAQVESTQVNSGEKRIEIQTTPQVAFNIKMMEFDKAISVLETELLRVKLEKANFLHKTAEQKSKNATTAYNEVIGNLLKENKKE